MPRIRSKEKLLLCLHAVCLVSRTYLSLVVARPDGEIARDFKLAAGNGKGFLWGLAKWIGVGGPAVYCNAMVRYHTAPSQHIPGHKLRIDGRLNYLQSISFRTRWTRYIHGLYLNDDLSYYKLTNLDGGLTAGGGPDKYITSDLTLFYDSAAALYSSLRKPTLDLVVFNYQLAGSLGFLAFSGITANYIATAYLLRKLGFFSPS